MNVIFLSPNFPLHFYHFCAQLKALGANVLGIGDCPYDGLSAECKNALTEYYFLPSLEQYGDVYRAAAYFSFRYGKADFIESQNEYWLETEAKLREDFNVPNGFRPKDMPAIKQKSLMKKGFARAKVPTARFHLVTDYEGTKQFLKTVGYPVIVKPDNGVGASHTERLDNEKQFERFYQGIGSIGYIMEEFIPGHIETFDGITNAAGEITFCAGQVMAKTPLDMLQGSGENVSWTQNVRETDLYQKGRATVKAFGTKNRFFHFEFFRLDEDKAGLGKKGDLVGLEVNMRAPGGYIPDKMNYAYDVDVYRIWAETLLYGENRSFRDSAFKRYVTHVGRSAGIRYVRSPEEIRRALGEKLIFEKQPPAGIAGGMGSDVFLLRADSVEELTAQARYILERDDGSQWF